jgi:hypothetical protein
MKSRGQGWKLLVAFILLYAALLAAMVNLGVDR